MDLIIDTADVYFGDRAGTAFPNLRAPAHCACVRNCGTIDRLAGSQDKAIIDPVPKLLRIAFDKFGLQCLTFRTDLEADIIEADRTVEVAVAFNLSQAPFPVSL